MFSVDAFIAPPCNDEEEQISRLGYYWKRPVFARTLITPFAMNPTELEWMVKLSTMLSLIAASKGVLRIRNLHQNTLACFETDSFKDLMNIASSVSSILPLPPTTASNQLLGSGFKQAAIPIHASYMVFPNTVNVATASSPGLSKALIEIVGELNESQITLVGPEPINGDHYTIANAINDYLNATGSSLIKKNIQASFLCPKKSSRFHQMFHG
ncbi:hypothetical protein KIN20_030482 [Parelaphostrongylus tenuis]|uniref:Uncharacterized protein n=1 Tax=Parelaphostrongylus tenuis TaxID=148309 RepID=A0AAD5R3R5_PARTN|nr:hypothetical protein KIN20_030482 [Parelaphostrongylus tenuis]